MIQQDYNSSTLKMEVEESQVQGQSGVPSKNMPQKETKKGPLYPKNSKNI
jgi:hypothetical protein